ncbi:hypothetical protein VE03_08597 [Pseudogymnoascus sp. 23342-1-I1]|nr:hypothetical protein VE03_08597 [Pseudogymnoascus sp. 23342-1-I1]
MGNDLASCPTWTLSEATAESYGYKIRTMKLSSFLKFGFVIYRCTYSDDAAWTQLLSPIQREAQEHIKGLGPGRDWLGAHLEWSVIEDPTLDGATQEQVKRLFDGWADGVVEEYERTSMDNAAVDGRKPPVFVILMRAEKGIPAWVLKAQAEASQHPRSGADSEDEEEEFFEDEEKEGDNEGDDIPLAAHQATWMYVETRYLLSLYNSLHSDSGWENFYVRPPGVYGRNEV